MERTSNGDESDAPEAATRRETVRERYSTLASGNPSSSSGGDTSDSEACCQPAVHGEGAPDDTGCCEPNAEPEQIGQGIEPERIQQLGYDVADVAAAPDAAEMSLGCGNPTAIEDLSAGEAVIDLGSGGGFDCFLAAREVGPDGHVVGVDMTPEMVETARENAAEGDYENVEFRLGEIEHLPAADESFDVVISNCVVNLSADKQQVFEEAYRVLRPGGRLAISDVVRTAELPPEVSDDVDALAACIAGAEPIDAIEAWLSVAGFTDVEITPDDESEEFIREWDDGYDPSQYLVSASISARKPE